MSNSKGDYSRMTICSPIQKFPIRCWRRSRPSHQNFASTNPTACLIPLSSHFPTQAKGQARIGKQVNYRRYICLRMEHRSTTSLIGSLLSKTRSLFRQSRPRSCKQLHKWIMDASSPKVSTFCRTPRTNSHLC